MRKRIEALLLGKLKHATPGLPCGGGISTASPAYPPASSDERRSHAAMNCNGNYSDGRYGKLRNGCPHSEIRSFRQPSCEPKKPPEHTLEGFLWYGHTGTIPAAIGCGAVVRKGSVRNLCTLPAFYICFWQLYPALHRRTSETRLPKRVLSEASVKAVFFGGGIGFTWWQGIYLYEQCVCGQGWTDSFTCSSAV